MLRSIQACRGIAALLVVLLHASTIVAQPQYFGFKPFGRIFDFGHAGVDFFFVLSGFIIYRVHADDIGHPRRIMNYARRRFLRIYPIYWALYIVFVVAAAVFEPRIVPENIGVFLGGLFLVPLDSALNGGASAPIIIVAWTLHHELLFYILFGLFIVSVWAGMLLLVVWVGVVVISKQDSTWPLIANAHNIEFLMGAISAYLVKCRIPTVGLSYAIIGAVFFAGTGVLEIKGILENNTLRVIFYGMSSAILVLGLATLEDRKNIAVPSLLRFLGDASYSIYLVHYPALGICCRLFLREEIIHSLPLTLLFAIVLIAAVVAGSLIYWVFERPMLATWRRTSAGYSG